MLGVRQRNSLVMACFSTRTLLHRMGKLELREYNKILFN